MRCILKKSLLDELCLLHFPSEHISGKAAQRTDQYSCAEENDINLTYHLLLACYINVGDRNSLLNIINLYWPQPPEKYIIHYVTQSKAANALRDTYVTQH